MKTQDVPPAASADAPGGPISECDKGSDGGVASVRSRVVPRLVCAAVAVAGVAWLASLLITRGPAPIHWTVEVGLATLAILCGVWSERQCRRRWEKPFRDLQSLLPLIRLGEAPIDELSKIRGGVEPLIPLLQDTMRDLRHQRTVTAELNDELRQRVALRTDALERQVGTLRQQATRDGLTGLYNRRMLDQHLPEILEKCRAEHRELALLMTDIDHFKHLNDTLGHAAGDELLKAVGQIARSSIRDGDFAFRCGGDEFVILLVGCDLKSSHEFTERFVSLTDGFIRNYRVDPRPRLSIGMSLLSELPRATPDLLLQAADKALYDMKFARKQPFSRTEPASRASA